MSSLSRIYPKIVTRIIDVLLEEAEAWECALEYTKNILKENKIEMSYVFNNKVIEINAYDNIIDSIVQNCYAVKNKIIKTKLAQQKEQDFLFIVKNNMSVLNEFNEIKQSLNNVAETLKRENEIKKEKILENAKKMGYTIKTLNENENKIKIVLEKRSF